MQLSVPLLQKITILNSTVKNYLIVYIGQDPFLLVKSNRRDNVQKHINFSTQKGEYYSTFLRNVNLSYARKLSQLVESLGITMSANLQYEWLMIYEIHSFTEGKNEKNVVQTPVYGNSVFVEENKKMTPCYISNVFKSQGQVFYFLSSSQLISQQFKVITAQNGAVYGITYKIKDEICCIPFHCILSEKPCKVCISEKIKPILDGTCFISYNQSYCTGFAISKNVIISARHVIPFEDKKLGLQVNVRFYPYNESQIGRITRIGQGSVDFIQVTLNDKIISKNHAAILDKRNYSFKTTKSYSIGNTIMSVGFGKFSYSPSIFHKVEVVMPKLEFGIISKVINLGHADVFIKTDAALYNGFSGSGVWLGENLIGMAVFILKNKKSESNYNRHNFSYTYEFIEKLLSQKNSEELISQINPQLQCMDRIQTRHKILLLPKL